MKEHLDVEVIDDLITSDEWDHVRNHIDEELKCCDIKGGLKPDDLPFIVFCESIIKSKLITDGFKKDTLDDPNKLELIFKALSEQGRKYAIPVWQHRLFPIGLFKLSDDNRTFWVKPDVDAALRTLESVEVIKNLLVGNDGSVNKNAVKIFLRSFELTINLARAGLVPKMAMQGAKVVDGGKNGGKESGRVRRMKAEPTKESWQAEAEKIWQKHPAWKNRRVAAGIEKRIGGNPDTIRKSIKKPLL